MYIVYIMYVVINWKGGEILECWQLSPSPIPINTLFRITRKSYGNNNRTYRKRNEIRHTLQFQKILHQ